MQFILGLQHFDVDHTKTDSRFPLFSFLFSRYVTKPYIPLQFHFIPTGKCKASLEFYFCLFSDTEYWPIGHREV